MADTHRSSMVDRKRLKEQAQQSRLKEAQSLQEPADSQPAPLFGKPIKMNRPKDPMHSLINKVLGNYEEVKPLVSHPSIIGAIHQPNTPVRTKPDGSLFPTPPAKSDPKDKHTTPKNNREKDHKIGSSGDRGRHAPTQQQNGELQKQNKVKDPRDRDNVFDKFLTSDNNGGQAGNRKNRRDSRSGERHKERGKERGRRSVSSEPEAGNTKHNKSHHEQDKKTVNKERMSRERDNSRNDRADHSNGSESKSSQEIREGHSASKSSSNNADQKGAGKGSQATAPSDKLAPSGPIKASQSNNKSPKRSVDRQTSSESSGRSEALNKTPVKASGGPAPSVKDGGGDRNFIKPMSVTMNGLTKRKDGSGDNGSRHKMAKLKMPNETHGQSALSVEKILEEMVGFDPPLTAIETPKKDLDCRFPFPTLAKDAAGQASRKDSSTAATTTTTSSTVSPAPAPAASTAANTSSRHRSQHMGAQERHGSSTIGCKDAETVKNLSDDLEVSSDSESEDKTSEQKQRRHSSTADKHKRSPKVSVNTKKMSDSSDDSSSSGSDSSDSGSDSESSSSDNEEEKEVEEAPAKCKSPTPPPPSPKPAEAGRSWALHNWKKDAQGSGLPGSEALLSGSQRGSEAKTIDKNDEILNIILQDDIPDPRLGDLIQKDPETSGKSSVKVANDNGLRMTISIGKGRGETKTPPRSTGRSQDKTPPRASGRSPSSSSVKSSGSSRSSVGKSPSGRPRKTSSKQKVIKEPAAPKKEHLAPSKPSPKVTPTIAKSAEKASPKVDRKSPSVSKTTNSKNKASPRTAASKTKEKKGNSTPRTGHKLNVKSREFLTSESDSSDDENLDVDVTSVTPVKKDNVKTAGGSTPKSNKGGRTKGSTGPSTPVKHTPPPPPPRMRKLPSPKPSDSSEDEKENVHQRTNAPGGSLQIDVEDVLAGIAAPLLSPIPSSAAPPIPPPPAKKATVTKRLSTSSTSSGHPVTEAPRKKQPTSPEIPEENAASSSSDSDSDSNSDSESSDSGSSSHNSSRASSRQSSPCSSKASSRASSPSPAITTHHTPLPPSSSSSSSSSSMPSLQAVPAVSTVTSTHIPGVTYNSDGKASIMVRLDRALIKQLPSGSAPGGSGSAAGSLTSTLLPPPPPRDPDMISKKPVAVVEPQQSHVDKMVMDMKLDPTNNCELHPSQMLALPHQSSILIHKDSAIEAAAMAMAPHAAPALTSTSHDSKQDTAYRKETADTILAKIIKDERKPPQTKIPKRKNTESHPDYSSDHKRARNEHRSSSGHSSSSRTPSRSTQSQNTPKRSEDVVERERTSHEDDHEWDRKYPPRSDRSLGSGERERRGGSCGSTSSHHSDRERGGKRSKYDEDKDRSRARNRDREQHRDRDRERDRDRDRHSHRGSRDWDAPNGEDGHNEESSSYNNHSTHPAANQWSAMASAHNEEWPERPERSNHNEERVDRRHEWRRIETRETVESADHYLSEARRLKHHADTLMDRFAKSMMYVEAVLSFIQCGNAMEHDRISEPNKIFTMYKDTFSLIRHIYKFRGSHEGDVHDKEKKLSVLSLRIQSLLCLKLFNLKKTETANLKRAIDDHTRQNANQVARPQAPSPYQTNWNRSTGTPSPMSPTPSPAGSVGSVGSVLSPQGSNNGDHRNHSSNGSTSTNTVSVPSRVHAITQSYMSHVHNLVQCHELWEQAENQAADFPEWIRELDYEAGGLNLHSSILNLVSYVRTGLRSLNNT